MRRIAVLEAQSGLPLYDGVWKWKEDQHQPEVPASLNKFFHLLARTVDNGVVKKVVFQRSEPKQHVGDSKFNAMLLSGRRKTYNRLPTSEQKKIEMYCASNEYVDVTLYIDAMFDKDPMETAQLLLRLFTERFESELLELKSQFADIATRSADEAQSHVAFMPRFEGFEEIVSTLRISPGAMSVSSSDAVEAAEDGKEGHSRKRGHSLKHSISSHKPSASVGGGTVFSKGKGSVSVSRTVEDGERRTSISLLLDEIGLDEEENEILD
jgi:hypothetical protein